MSDEVEQHVLDKYDLVQKLGKGAYGVVWKALDKKYKKTVAMKKVFDAFHNATDAQRTYREVMFLQELNGHDNIIRLRNVIKAENLKDLYLVFDFMETDLHHVIRANILQDIHKQYIIYQLLKALKYIHSADLIHRDLKPSNILINSECFIKVADFGLARSVASMGIDDSNIKLTDYVATRWYRAPEILLGSTKYSKAVDMWSVGCIIGELIVGKPLFPGTSTLNQIERVLELTGKPTSDDMESMNSQHTQTILSSITSLKKKSYHSVFAGANEAAIDLIKKLLSFNPNNRPSADEALKHPYVAQFAAPDEETNCDHIITIPMDDNKKFTIKEYREGIYNDIAEKKKEQRKKLQQQYISQLAPSANTTTEPQQKPQQQPTSHKPSSSTSTNNTSNSTSTTNYSSQSQSQGYTQQRPTTSSSNSKPTTVSKTYADYQEEQKAQVLQEKKQNVSTTKSNNVYTSPSTQTVQKYHVTKQASPGNYVSTNNTSYTKTNTSTSSAYSGYVQQSSLQQGNRPPSQNGTYAGSGNYVRPSTASSGSNGLLKKK
jgi:mitogen-activated protein kinase 15